jgi:putative ABC transport system permease protein
MNSLLQDLRYGARMLLKTPGFTFTAVVTLALGIGANTAIFSVINAVILRPLPFAQPDELVILRNVDKKEASVTFPITWPDFADFRSQQSSFEQLAAFSERDLTLIGAGQPVRLRGAMVTTDLFPLLGQAPQLGRSFTSDEERPGTHSVILSNGLWRRRFNSDPNVIGQTVSIKDRSYAVVGVMPAGFSFPVSTEPVELWINAGIDGEPPAPRMQQRGNHYLDVIGRLKAGTGLAQAQIEIGRIADGLASRYPEMKADLGITALPFFEHIIGDVSQGLFILLGAVFCVLLIACANMTNLLLARSAMRRKEITIRAALGASRVRVVRQLMIESLLLSLCGGLAGLLLAVWGTDALMALAPTDFPRLTETSFDGRVLAFTLAISLVTGTLFGLAPAWRASRTELTETLKDSARGTSASGNRFRHVLIIAQVAVAFCLLIGAGLLIKSFWQLKQVDPGFDPHNLLSFRVSTRHNEPREIEQFYQQLVSRIEALPGVTSASGSFALPLSGVNPAVGLAIEGEAADPTRPFPDDTELRIVRPNYFHTMGIALLEGRDFDGRDKLDSTQVAIVNESFARRYFPNQNPLGRRVKPSIMLDERGSLWREIVGVVKDVRHARLSEAPAPELFVTQAQATWAPFFIVARTSNEPLGLSSAVRQEVSALDKDLPVYAVKTLEEYLGSSITRPRFLTLLLSLFASLALALTAVGLYGVMAYSVSQRTHEMGIRMALGAQGRDVLWLVLGKGMTLALGGVAIGLIASLALTRLMQGLLFGVSETDPLTFALIAAVLTGVTMLACYLPARRAMRVDPMIALRYE